MTSRPSSSLARSRPSSRAGARPSLYPSDPTATLPSGIQLSPAQLRVREQQREFAGYLKIEAQVKEMHRLMTDMADRMGELREGTDAVATVTENWPNVFRAMHLALTSIRQQQLSLAQRDLKREEAEAETKRLIGREDDREGDPDELREERRREYERQRKRDKEIAGVQPEQMVRLPIGNVIDNDDDNGRGDGDGGEGDEAEEG